MIARAVTGGLVLALGAVTILIAVRHGTATTYAGHSGTLAAFELAAGCALALAGLATRRRFVAAAAVAWFIPTWAGWEGGPDWVRSVATLAAGAWIVLVLQALLPRAGYRWLRVLLWSELTLVVVARALFREPFEDPGCWDFCEHNVLLSRSLPEIATATTWLDLGVALVVVIALCRRITPSATAAVVIASVSAAHAVVVLATPLEDPQTVSFIGLFVARCLAALGVALALGWGVLRAHRALRAVERLSDIPAPGAFEGSLARASGDPSLRVAFCLLDDGRYVDSQGRTVPTPAATAGRAVTPILRDGQTVALLEHDPQVLDDRFLERIGAAALLAIENERLQAEGLARLLELRASRARIVEAGDAARRRLERDLHDGAQQRLVALSFALRIAAHEGVDARALIEAERALADALAAVRAVANGLFPATLATAGLAVAIEELAEHGPIRVEIETVPDQRLPADIEAAAYGVIREAVENAALHARASSVAIRAFRGPSAVIVEAEDDGAGGADPERGDGLLDAIDRVGALGGHLSIVSPRDGGTRIRVEIPCG